MLSKVMARLSLVVALSVALASLVRAGVQSPVQDAVERIKAFELATHSPIMDLAGWLTDAYGPRPTGSPNLEKAADWAVATLKSWGLDNVAIEPWVVDESDKRQFGSTWTNEKFHLAAVSPQPFLIRGAPGPASTNGLVRGEVVMVNVTTLDDVRAKWAGRVKGKWVMTIPPPEVSPMWEAPARRFSDEELLKMDNATLAPRPTSILPAASSPTTPPSGPRPGIVFRDVMNFLIAEGILGRFTPHGGHGVFAYGPGGTDRIPEFGLLAEDYSRIARLVAKSVPVVVEADVRNTVRQSPRLFNVVAEIRGTDKADELVMLGAHLDSVQHSVGATDNAAGVVAMMEAMRILKQSRVRLRRTVRLALWTGEEQGNIGSRRYVAQHFGGTPNAGGAGGPSRSQVTAEHAKVSAYFNLDMGTGAIRGVYLQQNEAVRQIFRQWIEPFRAMGMTTLTIQNGGQTDHLSFDDAGLPGFQFIQDPIDYRSITHHTNSDTFERLLPADLRRNATIAAAFAYFASIDPDRLPRKPLPAGRAEHGLESR
jgi:carboxypeptidase Q